MTTLVWQPSTVDGLIEAASARPLPPALRPVDATNAPVNTFAARYIIEPDSGFRPDRPDEAPAFLLTIVYDNHDDDVHEIDLGRHYPDLNDAKAAAERYEHTGHVYSGADTLRYRDANLNARFLPQDPRDDTTRPCLHIGGVQVYAYVHERTGQLVIAVHCDTADAAVLNANGSVPLCVSVGDTSVFDA